MYRSASGRQINADINGAVNIGRKELGQAAKKKLQRAAQPQMLELMNEFWVLS